MQSTATGRVSVLFQGCKSHGETLRGGQMRVERDGHLSNRRDFRMQSEEGHAPPRTSIGGSS